MNLILLVFKTEKLPGFLRPGSKLFYSNMIGGKEGVFEKVVVCI